MPTNQSGPAYAARLKEIENRRILMPSKSHRSTIGFLTLVITLAALLLNSALWQAAQASKAESEVATGLSSSNPVAMQMNLGGCTGANFSQAMGSPIAAGMDLRAVAVGDF